MSIPTFRSPRRLMLSGAAVAALLIGGAANVSAQNYVVAPQQQQQASAPTTAATPAMPLGHDDVVELQNQLIALGYNPGPADGAIGPATTTAVQQYDQSHGGNGSAPIDSVLLARLKADPGQRLSYEQVAERSRQAQASSPSSGASQVGSIVQTIAPLIGAAIANSNNNDNYYGPPPGYYGPGPGYYGPRPYYGY